MRVSQSTMRAHTVLLCFYAALVFGQIGSSEYASLFECAQFAAIAYCLKVGLNTGRLGDSCKLETCQRPEFSDIEVLDTFDLNDWGGLGSGYLALDHQRHRVVLAIRGTSSRRDWLGNLDAVPVSYVPISASEGCDDCRVHKGFSNFLRTKCADIINTALRAMMRHADYQLVVTGHSLGAALALLAGIEFELMGLEPLVVAFASPRVGNRAFGRWVDATVFKSAQVLTGIGDTGRIDAGYIRVIHEGDFVPMLPPAPIYSHAGVVYEIRHAPTPHQPHDLKLHGVDHQQEAVAASNPLKLWPSWFGRDEHKHYMIRVTGCRNDD